MITTLMRAKTVLNIKTSDKDLRIDKLIPLVEQDYLHIRNKPFDVGNTLAVTAPCTTSGSLTVTVNGTDFAVPVLSGDNALVVARKISLRLGRVLPGVSVSGATVTFKGYYELTFAAGGTGTAATISGIDTIYPVGAESTAIKMINHHLTGGAAGVSSESLGDYSVSYSQEQTADYPKSITGGIKRYVSFT